MTPKWKRLEERIDQAIGRLGLRGGRTARVTRWATDPATGELETEAEALERHCEGRPQDRGLTVSWLAPCRWLTRAEAVRTGWE